MSRTWPTPRAIEDVDYAIRVFLAWLAIVLVAATLAAAQPAVVKGEVLVPDRGLEADSWRAETVVQIRPGSATPAHSGSEAALAATARIEVRHLQFVPRVLAVPVGATIAFVNRDEHIHNVLSSSATKKFDLGMTAPGESGQVVFDRPGRVRVVCNAEAAMEGFVVVADTDRFAVADGRGRFEIGGLTVGSYVLEGWNPHYETIEQPLSIHRPGEVMTANVEFRKRRTTSDLP